MGVRTTEKIPAKCFSNIKSSENKKERERPLKLLQHKHTVLDKEEILFAEHCFIVKSV